jgi:peptidoglycan/xylan/chitin deacetylase (PgdA/CDA1 family)
MNSQFSVVMYHYVRDLQNTRYPAIKGLDIRLFREQLKYFKKHYNFITAAQLIDAYENGTELPPKSLLLTFDDAYLDHYTYAFPLLDEYKAQGLFFVPVKAIMNHEVLIVNKIHHVLAICDKNINGLVQQVKTLLVPYEGKDGVQTFDYYFGKLAVANRFDCKEVIFVKRLLQVELQEPVRSAIINQLFSQYVNDNEAAFSRELYMSKDHLRCMQRNGMIIGSHGYDHFWLGSLTKEEQLSELTKSVDFLKGLGVDMRTLSIGYPYGSHNEDTLDIARGFGFKLGFTTKVDVASTEDNCLMIPRLDTNDFPKEENAQTNDWFVKG